MIRATSIQKLIVAIVVALSGLVAVGAVQATAAMVTVIDRNGNQKPVNFDTLAGSFQQTEYTVRFASGTTTKVPVTGITIADFLLLVDADPAYEGIAISSPSGGKIKLTQEQIVTNGGQPMLITSGSGIGFIRPQYSKADVNGADYFTDAGSISLTQIGSKDFDLVAKIKTSKTKIKAGQSVSFEGSASGAGAGQEFEYSWDFDDGSTASRSSVDHKFKERGTYNVLLVAKAKSGSFRANKVVVIQVGAPTKSKKNRTGGGINSSAGAPESGVADGNSGDGETASSERRDPAKKRKKKTQKRQNESLEVVTGELLSAEAAPVQPQTGLAARSGTVTPPKSTKQISPMTVVGASVLLLLGFGFASEFGQPGSLRRRLRGQS